MTATKIEWAEHTWNPVAGCTRVNAACDNCYAVRMTHRLENMGQAKKYGGLTVLNPRGDRHFNGQIRLIDDALTIPLKRRKPTPYFVNSMSDVFHDGVPFEFIDKICGVMLASAALENYDHRFIVLTKRPKTARSYFTSRTPAELVAAWAKASDSLVTVGAGDECFHEYISQWPAEQFVPLPNLILGVSVHDQASADEFIPELLATPTACRAVSYEPALGPVDWEKAGALILPHEMYGVGGPYQAEGQAGIDWLIAGGESGPGARPAHPDWFRQARDQCKAAGVAYFFKQWGNWCPCERLPRLPTENNIQWLDDITCMYKRGKKRAGRLLDGREHNELPKLLVKNYDFAPGNY